MTEGVKEGQTVPLHVATSFEEHMAPQTPDGAGIVWLEDPRYAEAFEEALELETVSGREFLMQESQIMSAIHPAPSEFSGEQLASDPILRYFHYAHLPDQLQAASKPFCDLARHIVETLPRNAERTVALRKLLEAKDAGVRANVT